MTPATTTPPTVEQLLTQAADLAAGSGSASSAQVRALIEQLEHEKAAAETHCRALRDEAPQAIVRSAEAAEEHGRKEAQADAAARRIDAALSVLGVHLTHVIAREETTRLGAYEEQAKDIIGQYRALEARRREILGELVDIHTQIRALAAAYREAHGALTATGRLEQLGDDFVAGPRLPDNANLIAAIAAGRE